MSQLQVDVSQSAQDAPRVHAMLVILDAGSLFIREDDGHTTMVICGSSSNRPPMGIDQPRSSRSVNPGYHPQEMDLV